MYRAWVEAGKPTNPENELFQNYKTAKQTFRREQRNKAFHYEMREIDDICKNQQMDQKFFWYLVNKPKRIQSKIKPIKDDNGNMITNPHDITKEWGDYFKWLYSNQGKQDYDETFRKTVSRTGIICNI